MKTQLRLSFVLFTYFALLALKAIEDAARAAAVSAARSDPGFCGVIFQAGRFILSGMSSGLPQ